MRKLRCKVDALQLTASEGEAEESPKQVRRSVGADIIRPLHNIFTYAIIKSEYVTYFSAFPKEAEDYYNEVIAYEKEQERLREEMDEKVIKYIKSLSKDELCQKLYEVLYEAPEWMFERFYRENIEW